MARSSVLRTVVLLSLVALLAPFALGQQTGSVSGRVTASDGSGLPGVTVEARSASLPQPRVTTTGADGNYRLPALQPGQYTLTFSLSGMQSRTERVGVLLDQEATVNTVLGMSGLSETVTVTADSTLVDPNSTAIASALDDDVIEQLPMRQEYRDLVKLIPAVQYSEDTIRGPSAGGSGQDNVYQFDGVNVTLPLYGTLSAEPSSHDIAQVSVVKGGAKAVDFNRAGGFTIDSVSKSGTNEFTGQLSYQVQSSDWAEDEIGQSQFDEDKNWTTFGIGGPILADRLFFYGSYYRPEVERGNRSNLYGELPDLRRIRNEYFGKLTFTPTSNILLNGSYRTSDNEGTATGILSASFGPMTTEGEEATLDIGILEGSWVINDRSFATFKVTDFENKTLSRPDHILGFSPNPVTGTTIDVNNLDQLGLLVIPVPISGNANFNTFIAPLIDRYGYIQNGQRVGGGRVGVASTFSADDFYRESAQVGYDMSIGGSFSHDLHFGYQWHTDTEELERTSNGWGRIEVPGGRLAATPNVYYQAIFIQGSLGTTPVRSITGEFESHNIELNDSMNWGNWNFNLGVLLSQDTLYGQGLREDSSSPSGYVLAAGNMYKMYEIDFADQIQPRVGTTWAYNGTDTVYASWSRYNPSTSSLPRAASWDRNLIVREVTANFDQQGRFINLTPLLGSTGKLFQEDMDPRFTDEYTIGTSQQLTNTWSARAYGRYRYSANFWEDTQNNARIAFRAPEGYPQENYIAGLPGMLANLGGGSDSSYVIAELDNSFTKYYEVSLESEWRGEKTFLRGSYTWSHYYGNFDQDNTTTVNDAASFVGSSFIGDGAGRQLWNRRYGDLRGDRRHMLKLYGYYTLPWNATTGAFGVYQSGQPWEQWNYRAYSDLTTSTADSSRYAEPAGTHTTEAHHQLDLNYTQNIPISGLNIQLALDVFNVYDNQTGYNIQNQFNSANYGTPRSYFDPRRFQLAVRLLF